MKRIVTFMEVNQCSLILGQCQGYSFYRIFYSLQVHPGGPKIYAADDPATFLYSTPALSFSTCLYHVIKPHTSMGGEKVR